MTAIHFDQQINRLKLTFGDKSFSSERIKLIWASVHFLDDYVFTKIVNHMISTFKVSPLPKDFNDAARMEKHHANKLPMPSLDNYDKNALRRVLETKYPGCTKLWEAVEIERLKLQVKKADQEHGE